MFRRWKHRVISLIVATPLPRLVYRLRRQWQALARPLSVGVQALVVDPAGRVLLIHHVYVDGWHLPGGRVDKGETAAAAAVRELREETGLKAGGDVWLFGLYGRFCHGGSDHIALYVVSEWSGSLCVDGLEVDAANFYSFDALPPDTASAVRRRLTEYRDMVATADRW